MLKKKRVINPEFCVEFLEDNRIPFEQIGSAIVFESFWGDEYLIRGQREGVTKFDTEQLHASQLRKDQLRLGASVCVGSDQGKELLL